MGILFADFLWKVIMCIGKIGYDGSSSILGKFSFLGQQSIYLTNRYISHYFYISNKSIYCLYVAINQIYKIIKQLFYMSLQNLK